MTRDRSDTPQADVNDEARQPFEMVSLTELARDWVPPDPMLEIEDGELRLRWGRRVYPIDVARIRRPEDLLWWLHHLSKKTWPQMTPQRIGLLIEAVAEHRGWKLYHRVSPPEGGAHD